jgi:hypothetical protein
MTHRLRLLALVIALAGMGPSASPRGQPPARRDPDRPLTEQERKELLERLPLGSSPEDAVHLLGSPDHRARQVLYQHYLEQWVYERPLLLRLEFDYPRGQPPRLRSSHLIRPSKGAHAP